MDEGRAGILAVLIDGVAAAAAAIAVAASLWLLGMPLPALLGGSGAMLATFAGLQALGARPRRMRMPAFAVPEWQHVLGPDTPLGSARHGAPRERGNVVELRPRRALPRPAAIGPRVDPRLSEEEPKPGNVLLLAPDASAALRAALAELNGRPARR